MSLDKHVRSLTLDPGEVIRVAVACLGEVGGQRVPGALIVTDRRVAFASKGMLGSGAGAESIPRAALSGVDHHRGSWAQKGSVRLSSAGARIEATAMKRADVEAAVAALQSW